MLFVSRRRLQDRGNCPENLPLGPDEYDFCSSVSKRDRRTEPRTKLFLSEGRLRQERLQARILSWVHVPVNMLGLGIMIIVSYDI
jgi:hypothetical protein